MTHPDYRELADFRFEIRRFLHFSEAAAREAGIEPQQHQALLAIKGMPSGTAPTVGVLAERLLLRHQSVVGLVDRLERSGLVQRVPGREDHRQVIVHLTHQGEAILERLSLTHREELEETAPQLARALQAVIRRTKATQNK